MEEHAGAPTRPSLLNWNLALLQSSYLCFIVNSLKASVWLRSCRLLITSYVLVSILFKSKRGLHSCRLRTHYNNIVHDVSLIPHL